MTAAGLYLCWGRRRRPAPSPTPEPRGAREASREPSGVPVARGWSEEQSCSTAVMGLRRHSRGQRLQHYPGVLLLLCKLRTDSKHGFTCLPRLINHFPEDFSWQLLVMAKRGFIWHSLWPANSTLQKCVRTSITSPLSHVFSGKWFNRCYRKCLGPIIFSFKKMKTECLSLSYPINRHILCNCLHLLPLLFLGRSW